MVWYAWKFWILAKAHNPGSSIRQGDYEWRRLWKGSSLVVRRRISNTPERPRTRSIEFQKAQRGWYCEWYFAIYTANQCTREEHAVRGGGDTWFGAWLDARKKQRELVREIACGPREREALGW